MLHSVLLELFVVVWAAGQPAACDVKCELALAGIVIRMTSAETQLLKTHLCNKNTTRYLELSPPVKGTLFFHFFS
jgi:hypothetical protein